VYVWCVGERVVARLRCRLFESIMKQEIGCVFSCRLHVHTYSSLHTHKYIYPDIQTHTHTHTYIYIYIYISLSPSPLSLANMYVYIAGEGCLTKRGPGNSSIDSHQTRKYSKTLVTDGRERNRQLRREREEGKRES